MSKRELDSEFSVKLLFITLIAGTAALGGFLFGFDTAIINGAVTAIQGHFEAGSMMTGLAVSLALIGSAVGAFFVGSIADRIGRTRSMVIASVLFTISAIGSGLPITIYDFIFWRFVGGVGVGAASVIAPAYIAEVAPARLRGRMGTLQQLAIVIGIFIALLSSYVIASAAGGSSNEWLFGVAAWRWMFWSEIPPAVLYGVAALFIPESPRYLVAAGKEATARQVLDRYMNAAHAEHVLARIKETVRTERKPKFSDLLGDGKKILPIVWVGMGLSALQQFVGINVIFYYSSVLWQAVGFTEENALLITVITGLVNIITTVVAIATVDKFGRKPLLILGSIGMTLTLGTMAVLFSQATLVDGNPTLEGSSGMMALIAANLYVFCFGFSWGPVVWVLLGEMFNNKIRAIALSVAAAVQWVSNFLISSTFPVMLKSLGLGAAYGIYTAMALISVFFVIRFVKETKGKSLEDM